MSVKKQFSSNIVTVSLQIDDQISLLINAWCELLVLAACHRSSTCPPGTIRVSSHVSLGLEEARRHGIEKCVEKMLSFTEQLRRLKVDQFEYVSMKLICLLTSGNAACGEVQTLAPPSPLMAQCLQTHREIFRIIKKTAEKKPTLCIL